MIVSEKKHIGFLLENTIAVWATSVLTSAINSILADMDVEVYECVSACDLVMVPNFIQIVDGRLLIESDDDLPFISCVLTEYSGCMIQCGRCRHHQDCLTISKSRKAEEYDNYDFGPEYSAPTIMLHAEARQREVEGLLAIVPPMREAGDLSDDLAYWLQNTILHWHKKALAWRITNEKWNTLDEMRWLRQKAQKGMKRTDAEIAQEKWQPRSISLELRTPDFR